MKKRIFLTLFAFFAGFLTHALIFPDFLANGFTDISQIVIPESSPTTSHIDPIISQITYDGEHFSRHTVRIAYTRYIQITNMSPDKQMWLLSNLPDLATVRGYAQSEAVKAQMNKKGTIVVQDKNNPNEKLVITVK